MEYGQRTAINNQNNKTTINQRNECYWVEGNEQTGGRAVWAHTADHTMSCVVTSVFIWSNNQSLLMLEIHLNKNDTIPTGNCFSLREANASLTHIVHQSWEKEIEGESMVIIEKHAIYFWVVWLVRFSFYACHLYILDALPVTDTGHSTRNTITSYAVLLLLSFLHLNIEQYPRALGF